MRSPGKIKQQDVPAEDPKAQSPRAEGAQRSQTLVRGLEIIDAVSTAPASIAEIAAGTGLTYSTVHRIVSVLVEQRYLKLNDQRNFALGPRLIELGFAAHLQVDVIRNARPRLEDLARQTRDTVHLARWENGEVSYLDKLPGTRAVEISSRVGGRKPVISTGIGKALLLDMTDAELASLYDRDHHLMTHPTSKEEWMRRIRAYRAGGYAYDLGEDEASIRCVAAPLRDATRRIVAAISVSSTVEYMDEARMHRLIAEVQATARVISADLGYNS